MTVLEQAIDEMASDKAASTRYKYSFRIARHVHFSDHSVTRLIIAETNSANILSKHSANILIDRACESEYD
jgi:hypothetical protein